MRSEQRLFLSQAKSAYGVFRLLLADTSVHHCHAFHYLQMATELLGKASAWRSGPIGRSHKALVSFLRSLSSNPRAQTQLGYAGQSENWKHHLRKIIPLAENLQKMAPALAGDGPNPEYPWPTDAPTDTPAEYEFPIWGALTDTSDGRSFLALIRYLFDAAEEYM